jgi:hypothetical protein
MDYDCSKAVIFLPCTKEISTEGVIDLYAKHVFPHYGVPQQIISNRDPCFVSNLAQGICEKLGISQNISTAHYPQTDGQLEQANQHVEQYLHIYTNDYQNNWSSILPIAQFVYNTWPNATTGYTPLELLIRHTPLVNMAKTLDQLPHITQRAKMLEDLQDKARSAMKHAQTKPFLTSYHHHRNFLDVPSPHYRPSVLPLC